jgi:hypothetical protein
MKILGTLQLQFQPDTNSRRAARFRNKVIAAGRKSGVKDFVGAVASQKKDRR